MKRWTLMIVAMASALALIATPALAADQTRSQDRIQDQLQDGTCADCTVECDQLQLRAGEQVQTRTQECDPVQAGEQVQTMTKTATQLQSMTQTRAGEQVQAQTMPQAGEQVQAQTQTQAHAAEWAEKLERHQNQHAKKYAKCVRTIASSD
ncbi:MAG: hypothetical protein ACYCXR_04435 [Coriobacteriia bacterium]